MLHDTSGALPSSLLRGPQAGRGSHDEGLAGPDAAFVSVILASGRLSDSPAVSASTEDRRGPPPAQSARGGRMGMQPAMSPSRFAGRSRLRWIGLLASIGFSLLIGLLLFSRAMAQPFSHDEHQFVAAGWWVAYGSLIPYHDFPYHHMPYQIPLDALAVRLSPYLLLSTRLVSWAAGWLASGILFLMVRRELQARGGWLAAGAAAAAVVVFISNPITAYTTGRAWNHDWAIALALLALMLQVRVIDRQGGVQGAFVVGLLAGLAAGVRLSLAVLCPLLIASAWAIAGTTRQRGARCGRDPCRYSGGWPAGSPAAEPGRKSLRLRECSLSDSQ